MQVAELMLRDVTLVRGEDSVQDAARAIADLDGRFVLVGAGDRPVGILTIRDILIRVVAAGLDPTVTAVSHVMSSSLFTCGEQDSAESAARSMVEHHIDQMPVLDSQDHLVGIITRSAAETLSPAESAR